MLESSSWRELLGQIISNPIERERLANEIGVRSITLMRWVNGESVPRPHNIRQLLYILPQQYRARFLELWDSEQPALTASLLDSSPSELANDFVMQVLEARATTQDTLRFWTISRLVLQHALRQLDPERIGMAITVVQCMPPTREGMIRSLREGVGMGTPPWEGDLENRAIFLGAESLAGYAVMTSHTAAIQNLRETVLLPAYQTEHEVSAIASPILYANRIAGCLLFSSTQRDYFLSQNRQALVLGYTRLITLAFEREEFYPSTIINLQLMPPIEVQRKLFVGFQQRLHAIMRESFNKQHSLSFQDAEKLAWQQIEEELIIMSLNTLSDN